MSVDEQRKGKNFNDGKDEKLCVIPVPACWNTSIIKIFCFVNVGPVSVVRLVSDMRSIPGRTKLDEREGLLSKAVQIHDLVQSWDIN